MSPPSALPSGSSPDATPDAHRREGTEAVSPHNGISNEAGTKQDRLWAPEESSRATSVTQDKGKGAEECASPSRHGLVTNCLKGDMVKWRCQSQGWVGILAATYHRMPQFPRL